MKIEKFINKLRSENIFIFVQEGELKVKAKKELLTPEKVAQIKEQKINILNFYKNFKEGAAFNSIPVSEKKSYYTVSPIQKRIHFMYEFNKNSLGDNLPISLKLIGKLDKKRFEKTFQKLLARHEGLRSSFHRHKGEVVQVLHDEVDIEIEQYETVESEINGLIEAFIRPFDLSKPPLIRVGLAKITDTYHILLMDLNRIVSDWRSYRLLVKDCVAFYRGQELPKLRIQYKDYAEWQKRAVQQRDLVDQKEFWKNEFAKKVSVLNLPLDFPRPLIKTLEGSARYFQINNQETVDLKKMGEELGATTFMILLALFNILLNKLTHQNDIIVGTPITGRNHADLEKVIGMFVYTIAIRNTVNENLSFKEFLQQVQKKSLSCINNKSYQYEELMQELDIARDPSRNPLFDVLLTFQEVDHAKMEMSELQITPFEYSHVKAKLDLILRAEEANGKISLSFEYSKDLFMEQTIDRFIAYFKSIVKEVIAHPEKKLSEIEVISERERNKLLYGFNGFDREIQEGQTLSSLLSNQIQKIPNHIALLQGENKMSFGELGQKVDILAAKLVKQGIQQGDVVGIICEPSFDLIISIYAISKAGATFLPINPSDPRNRIHYILEDCKAKLVLSSQSYKGHINRSVNVLVLSASVFDEDSQIILESKAKPEGIAYIHYISSSVGKPKGVMITHSAIYEQSIGINSMIPLTGKTSLSVNFSLLDLFLMEALLPIHQGASVVLVDEEERKNPAEWTQILLSHEVNLIQATPSQLMSMIEANPIPDSLQLSEIILRAESIPPLFLEVVGKYTPAKIFRLHGPPEMAGCSTLKELFPEKSISIGRPIINTRAYILNQYHKLQPTGVVGELCLSGSRLSQGYINDDELTDKKFIENPFEPGEKIYLTGQLAKWTHEGEIHFMGRKDDQVNMHGVRVELGEVEKQVLTFGGIEKVRVISKERKNEKILICYFVSHTEIDTSSLREFLAGFLPSYMLPTYYLSITQFPLTSEGQVDIHELPAPEFYEDSPYMGEISEIENVLIEIWSEVLQIKSEHIDTNVSFFASGGNSLKLMLLVEKIEKRFNVEIQLQDVFTHQDINSLSSLIKNIKFVPMDLAT